jgi:lipoate synthase
MIWGTAQACRFCAVQHSSQQAWIVRSLRGSPARSAHGLRYVVVTSVMGRPRGWRCASSPNPIRLVREAFRRAIEVHPDSGRGPRRVLDAGPDVLSHNRRPCRGYRLAAGRPVRPALELLRRARAYAPAIPTKSGIMVGLGEEWHEVVETLADLQAAGVGIITIGQYLSPSATHLPVARYYHPDEFEMLRATAANMGFGHVECGPLVKLLPRADQRVRKPMPHRRLNTQPPRPATETQLVDMLDQMLLGRRYEQCAEMYAPQKIGFCHLCIGRSRASVLSTLRPDDLIITAGSRARHRQGLRPRPGDGRARPARRRVEGRAARCLFDKEKGMLGGHGIVSGHIPLATGTAFAAKYQQKDYVTLCFFGEAAVNIGTFHESLNMAALWKLPVIYIVENNRFGMGTAIERSSAIYDVAQRACAYDMASETVDGMDVRGA